MKSDEIAIIDEQGIKDMVYEIRGQKVMLDFDLARIYGYETKAFNQQVKNNADRFPEEFRFRLTRNEVDDPRSKILTSAISSRFFNQKGGAKYLPYAFTEQGVYMLMTVLKGELAVKQSIALIKAFKALKDAALATGFPLEKLEQRVGTLEEDVSEAKSQLSFIMSQFDNNDGQREWFIDAEGRVEADLVYQQIYRQATKTVLVIDDYVGKRTLHLLKSCPAGVSITLVSDNRGSPPLQEDDLALFRLDTKQTCPISLIPTHGKFHDRFILLDFGLPTEAIYHCGPSSKDAGNRIAVITKLVDLADFRETTKKFLGL